MSPAAAWIFWIVGFVLPLVHIGLSPRSGPWRPAADSGCPFSPRVGWLVMVLFLGPIGWLMYMAKRRPGPPSDG